MRLFVLDDVYLFHALISISCKIKWPNDQTCRQNDPKLKQMQKYGCEKRYNCCYCWRCAIHTFLYSSPYNLWTAERVKYMYTYIQTRNLLRSLIMVDDECDQKFCCMILNESVGNSSVFDGAIDQWVHCCATLQSMCAFTPLQIIYHNLIRLFRLI